MSDNSQTTHETSDHTKVEETDATKTTTKEHTESGTPEVKEVEKTIEAKPE